MPATTRAAALGSSPVVFTETSAIGLRIVPVGKTALSRSETTVDVDGHPVRVKLATLDGRVVNAQPEHDDVLAAARRPASR